MPLCERIGLLLNGMIKRAALARAFAAQGAKVAVHYNSSKDAAQARDAAKIAAGLSRLEIEAHRLRFAVG